MIMIALKHCDYERHFTNIARIANAVQVTLLSLSLSLPLSLKGLPKVSKKSPKSLSKVSLKSL